MFSDGDRKKETTIITSTILSIYEFSLIFRRFLFSACIYSNILEIFVIIGFDIVNVNVWLGGLNDGSFRAGGRRV